MCPLIFLVTLSVVGILYGYHIRSLSAKRNDEDMCAKCGCQLPEQGAVSIQPGSTGPYSKLCPKCAAVVRVNHRGAYYFFLILAIVSGTGAAKYVAYSLVHHSVMMNRWNILSQLAVSAIFLQNAISAKRVLQGQDHSDER